MADGGQVSIVRLSEIEENVDYRYEPEFWQPNYILEKKQLNHIKTVTLNECAIFQNGFAFDSEDFSLDGEIHVSKIGDVTQKRDFNLWERVSKDCFDNIKAKYLEHNDILMTLTGDPPDVGKVQLIFNPVKEKLSWNQRVAMLRLKKQDYILSSEFLFVVLSSKYCRNHVERWAKGIRQRNVGNPAVLNMAIPLIPKLQDTITKIVVNSFDLLADSKQMYKEAQDLLLAELGLGDWKPKHELTYKKRYSDTVRAGRIDAEYYQPKYDEVIEAIKNYSGGADTLGNLCSTRRGSLISEDLYTDTPGKVYIRGADFSGGTLSKNKAVYIDKEFTEKGETRVKENDIVFSLIGSVGETALVTKEFAGSYISNNTGKISCNNGINPVVLQVLLKSVIGKMYFEKYKTQTAQPKISDKDTHNFVLPILPKDKQDEIQQKVTRSFALRESSKQLLAAAKRAVEIAIEQDEPAAIQYLKENTQDTAP